MVAQFWGAPSDALFTHKTIAVVLNTSEKTLECNRWRKSGIPFRKVGGKVLYQKKDVIAWLNGHALVCSTSEYGKEALS